MANPFLTSKLAEVTRSHELAVSGVSNAIQQAGDGSIRAIQLWQIFMSMVDVADLPAAGAIVQADATEAWATNRSHLVIALDAAAAAMGVTRASLIAELSAAAPTVFA